MVTRLSPILLAGLLLALASGQAEGPPAPAAPPPAASRPAAAGPRVIVRESRRREVMGYVELENDDVIVVRTLEGPIESFAKHRIVRIIRLVDPDPGQRGTVILRNGQTRDGVIVDDTFEHVTIEIEGVRTQFNREVVDHVRLEPSFEERYRHLKTLITPGAQHRHLALCQWLVEEHRYELAEQELVELLRNEPMPEAQQLLRVVRAQIALEQAPRPTEERPGEVARDEPDLPTRLLTHEEVNTIRVYEIDFRNPPKVAVPRETIARFIDRFGTEKDVAEYAPDRTRLYRTEPLDLVRLFFKVKARSLYPEIEVLSEPYALNLFRERVHNAWLMNNCATSRCHGGPDGGRFFLHRRNFRDERVRYTNFLILERLKLDGVPLIDYEHPDESLIIQYGLPAPIARKPHPPARGWRPAFRGSNDRMIKATVLWLESMLHPRVEYPVEYEPPVLGPPPRADGRSPDGRSER